MGARGLRQGARPVDDATETPWSATTATASGEVLVRTIRNGRLAELLAQRALRPHALDPSQHAVLFALAAVPPPGALSPGELCSLLAQTPSGVTRTIRRLEQTDLVERSADPDDGRAVRLRLSADGRTKVRAATHDLLAAFDDLVGPSAAGDQEMVALARALEAVGDLLEPVPVAARWVATHGPSVASSPNSGSDGADPSDSPGTHVPDGADGSAGLGARIRRRRLVMGLTQRQLAAAVGAGAPHLSKVESGREQPGEALVRRLAEALQLDADELLLTAGIVPPWMLHELARRPRRAVETVRLWREADPG